MARGPTRHMCVQGGLVLQSKKVGESPKYLRFFFTTILSVVNVSSGRSIKLSVSYTVNYECNCDSPLAS